VFKRGEAQNRIEKGVKRDEVPPKKYGVLKRGRSPLLIKTLPLPLK
jgi:hypothetical protein